MPGRIITPGHKRSYDPELSQLLLSRLFVTVKPQSDDVAQLLVLEPQQMCVCASAYHTSQIKIKTAPSKFPRSVPSRQAQEPSRLSLRTHMERDGEFTASRKPAWYEGQTCLHITGIGSWLFFPTHIVKVKFTNS